MRRVPNTSLSWKAAGVAASVPPAVCSGKETMHHSSLRRAGALLASGAVAVAGLTLGVPGAASAAAPVQTAQVQGGAQWLRSQLTRGVVHNPNFGGFDDLGLTVDFGLAMEAVGEERDVTAIASTISRPANLGSYIGTGAEKYAGATAKALLLAQAAGGTGRSFGGVALADRLQSLVGTQGATAGRIADQSAFGDFANVLGQSYAVSSLDAAGSPSASSATGFLVQQQCAAGWFRLFLSDPTAADQSCDGAADATADVDATAVALMALLPQADDPTVADDVAEAVAWLLSQQAANGSFGGGTPPEGANTNSTRPPRRGPPGGRGRQEPRLRGVGLRPGR